MIATIAVAAALSLTGFTLTRVAPVGPYGRGERGNALVIVTQSVLGIALLVAMFWGSDGLAAAWAFAGYAGGSLFGTVWALIARSSSMSSQTVNSSR
ncbi:hypothetical protein [Paraoerskovia marina]|uniref:hypothetical protein n=1 Tax=Paraoerskovia marina TaxID=545619 RepID=UPI0004927B9E|nr:hypothetical protein [Paraoerskovia marina]